MITTSTTVTRGQLQARYLNGRIDLVHIEGTDEILLDTIPVGVLAASEIRPMLEEALAELDDEDAVGAAINAAVAEGEAYEAIWTYVVTLTPRDSDETDAESYGPFASAKAARAYAAAHNNRYVEATVVSVQRPRSWA